MQTTRTLAALVLVISCAIGVAACAHSTEANQETPLENDADEGTSAEPVGKPATQYIDCRPRGLTPIACSQVCSAAGAACGTIAAHPYKSGQGTGLLTWCKNGEPTFTCTYTFSNGDGCAITYTPLGSYWLCSYPGGN